MRVAIAISALAVSWLAAQAYADEPLVQVAIGSRTGYVVPEKYASGHQADLVASLPGAPKIDGYWTPSEQDAVVADRLLREMLEDGVKDPIQVFPDLDVKAEATSPDSPAYEARELALALKNYDRYTRQYVGLILDGRKIIFCNYADVPKIDPAKEYFYLHKYFEPDGSVHFLQGRVDRDWKSCSGVALIGSWEPKGK